MMGQGHLCNILVQTDLNSSQKKELENVAENVHIWYFNLMSKM